MSETLLDMAKSNYKMAERNFQFIREDSTYMNLTGHLLQQTIELALKHILEVNSIEYPKTHDIRTLMDLLPNNIQRTVEDIRDKADTITSWESMEVQVSEQDLMEGFNIVKRFLGRS